MPIAIFALSLAAFAIGTAEFIIAGVLPNLSADFSVSIPTAGLLVTGYAVAVAIGGPILSVLTTRLPRKPMIVGLLALFALGQAVCALAPSYGWLMAARIFVACSHGLFYGIASVAAADLVPLKKRGTALALFFGGITVANVLGVPGGTAIGNAFGWRWAFWAVGGFAGLATLLVAWLLPPGKRHADEDATLRSELKALTHHHVYLTYLVIAVVSVGAFSFATYQVPLMIAVTGIPQEVAPAFLIIAGIGTVIGIYAGGRATDWKLMPSLLAILLAQAAIATIMLFASRLPVADHGRRHLHLRHLRVCLQRAGPDPHPRRLSTRPQPRGDARLHRFQFRHRAGRLGRWPVDRSRARLCHPPGDRHRVQPLRCGHRRAIVVDRPAARRRAHGGPVSSASSMT